MNIHFEPVRANAERLTAVVTNVTQSGSVFARHMETMRDIYVRRTASESLNLKVGQMIDVFVEPSHQFMSWVPDSGKRKPAELFAQFIVIKEGLDEQPEPVNQPEELSIRDRILDVLQEGAMTAKYAAEKINIACPLYENTYTVADEMMRMHREGLICRAVIKSREGQTRAGRLVYALTVADLMPSRVSDDE